MADNVFQGSLFSNDFLKESIALVAEYQGITDEELDAFSAALRGIFDRFPTTQTP